jgi:hypothetical protein
MRKSLSFVAVGKIIPWSILLGMLAGAGYVWSMHSRQPVSPPAPSNAHQQHAVTAYWHTYTDAVHGFSVRYPKAWGRLPPQASDALKGPPPGIEITAAKYPNCHDARAYARNELIPRQAYILQPLPRGDLDGFITYRILGPNRTTGPAAYILNCPVVIRIGFNPTGIAKSEQLFTHLLSTITVWPPQTPMAPPKPHVSFSQ